MPRLVYNQQTEVSPGMTPADAQGARVSPAIGEGLQELGQQGTRLSADYARIEYMRQHANDVTQLQNNITQGTEDFDKIGDQLKQDVGPSGVGYADQLMAKFHPWAQQVLEQQKNPQVQQMAARQLKTMELGLFREARNYEANTTRAWRVGSFENSINSEAELVGKDPTLFEPLMNEKLDALHNIQGLHPMDSFNLANKVKSTYSEAAMLSDANNRPQWTVNMLQGTQPLTQGSIQQKIVDAANAKGVDPHTALTFAQFESKMDPNAQNGSSTGLFQVQPDTAKPYGVTDLTNPDENIKAGIGYMADNTKAFRTAFKRDPSASELYAMHLLGTGGGIALQSAPDDQPFSEFANNIYQKRGPKFAQLVQSGNHLTGMTVGQVKQQFTSWMSGAAAQTQGMATAPAANETPDVDQMPSYFRMATPQQREAILTHSQNILRKDDSQARALIHSQVQDTIAAYQMGEAAPNAPTVSSMVKAGMPYAEAADLGNKLQTWQTFGSNYAKMKLLPPDQRDSLVESMKPVAGTPSYATQAQAYDAADKANKWITAQQTNDQMGYWQKETGAPEVDMSSPQALGAAMKDRYIQAAGVAKDSWQPYRPFSQQAAAQLGQIVSRAPTAQAKEYLAQLAANTPKDHPEYYQAAIQQIAPDHPVEAVAGQHAAMPLQPGQPDVANLILEGDRILNPGKGNLKEEGKFTKIPLPPIGGVAGLRTQWENQVGAAYGSNFKSSEQDFNAALSYYVARKQGQQSEVPDNGIWNEAIQAVSPHTYHAGIPTLLPLGTSPDQFQQQVGQVWPQVMRTYGLDPANHPNEAYPLVQFNDGSYAVTSGTSTLYGADGRPVRFFLDGSIPTNPGEQPLAQPRMVKKDAINVPMDKRFR